MERSRRHKTRWTRFRTWKAVCVCFGLFIISFATSRRTDVPLGLLIEMSRRWWFTVYVCFSFFATLPSWQIPRTRKS